MTAKSKPASRHNPPSRNMAKRLTVWAALVAAVLTIPFFADWRWTGNDYIFGAVLLFGAALVYELATRRVNSSGRRLVIGAAVFVVLAILWIGAATGYGQ